MAAVAAAVAASWMRHHQHAWPSIINISVAITRRSNINQK